MSAAPEKPQLRMVEVTRADYESGQAFEGWQGDPGFGRIGGSFGELLTSVPGHPRRDDDLLLLAALLEDRPIGCMHTFNGKVHVGDQTINMLWCSGLVVKPEHRSTGAGLMILLRMRARPVASGGVRVSQMALPIYKQLGWQHLTAARFLLVKRSAPILQRWISNPLLRQPAAALVNLGMGLHRLLLGMVLRIKLSGWSSAPVEQLPQELDAQIRGLRRPAKCHRSTEWLNWAASTGPMDNQRRLWLVKSRTGKPVGYFMTGQMHYAEADQGRIKDITLASVLDWMSFDNDVDDTIILLSALQQLLRADVDAVELCVPETGSGRALRRLGLLCRGELNMVIRFAPGTPDVEALQMDGDNFWFRPADADGFVN